MLVLIAGHLVVTIVVPYMIDRHNQIVPVASFGKDASRKEQQRMMLVFVGNKGNV